MAASGLDRDDVLCNLPTLLPFTFEDGGMTRNAWEEASPELAAVTVKGRLVRIDFTGEEQQHFDFLTGERLDTYLFVPISSRDAAAIIVTADGNDAQLRQLCAVVFANVRTYNYGQRKKGVPIYLGDGEEEGWRFTPQDYSLTYPLVEDGFVAGGGQAIRRLFTSDFTESIMQRTDEHGDGFWHPVLGAWVYGQRASAPALKFDYPMFAVSADRPWMVKNKEISTRIAETWRFPFNPELRARLLSEATLLPFQPGDVDPIYGPPLEPFSVDISREILKDAHTAGKGFCRVHVSDDGAALFVSLGGVGVLVDFAVKLLPTFTHTLEAYDAMSNPLEGGLDLYSMLLTLPGPLDEVISLYRELSFENGVLLQ
jgi:hypothetical protein